MKRIWTYVLSGTMALALAAPAMARERGRGHDRGDDRRASRERYEDRHEANYQAYRRARWNDHDADDRRPSGWDHGRKTGWGGRDLPPGQAKKHRDWDRDDRHARRHHHRHHREVRYGRRDDRPVVIPTRPRPIPQQPTVSGRGPIPVPRRPATTTANRPTGHGPIVVPR